MGLLYLLADICDAVSFFLAIPAVIFKNLAIYFQSAIVNNENNEEEE